MTPPVPAKPVYRAVCTVPNVSYSIKRDGVHVAHADAYCDGSWRLNGSDDRPLSEKRFNTPQMAATEAKRMGLGA